jgi:hypothetical protein
LVSKNAADFALADNPPIALGGTPSWAQWWRHTCLQRKLLELETASLRSLAFSLLGLYGHASIATATPATRSGR